MEKLNVIGIETRFGFRTAELIHGDVAELMPTADVLVVSAFAGSYQPVEGTVMQALMDRHSIDLMQLARSPKLDLRDALGVWLSLPLESGPARHILVLEMHGTGFSLEESLDNVFAALFLLDAKGIATRSVAMPLLGTGSQQIEAHVIASALIPRVRQYLERSSGTEAVQFVEIRRPKAEMISTAMNRVLGRVRVTLPHQQLTEALRADIRNRLLESQQLFSGGSKYLLDDWLHLMDQPEFRSFEFGVLGRRLVELVLTRLEIPNQALFKRIRVLEESGRVAPWICGYMHVLRHLGNESSHESLPGSVRMPAAVSPSDLTAGLYCVERILDFWLDSQAVE